MAGVLKEQETKMAEGVLKHLTKRSGGVEIKEGHLRKQDGRSIRHVGPAPDATPAPEEETTVAANSDPAR